MEIEIAEQLKTKLEHELHKKLVIFEELTGLKIADVDIMRIYSMGSGGSEIANLTIRVEM